MNNWDEQMISALNNYSAEVGEAAKRAIDTVAEGVMETIKSHITFKKRTGKYVKAFTLTTLFENATYKSVIWHVKSPHYRLSHLLEKSHLTRNGKTRTKAYPHIIYGEQYAKANLEKEVVKEIER